MNGEHAQPALPDLLGEVLAAWLEAAEQGKAIDRSALVARYPEFARELEQFFAQHEHMDRLAAPLREVFRAGTPGPGEKLADPSWAPEPRSIGDYELLEEIGRGGMGVVYKARQQSLDRLVALKVFATDPLATDAERQRFLNEARMAAHLDHPRIVPIYEVGRHEDRLYYTMKLIDGGNLLAALPRFPLNPRAAAELVAEIAEAVHYAHEHGILHRDLKPSNVVLDKDGRPHVTDFGLAKWFERDSSLSESGVIVGTPSYMAPEQAAGHDREIGPRADVYGLGAILYALLTGRPPFRGLTILETLDQVRTLDPVPPSRLEPGFPRALEAICLKCLEKEPRLRYASGQALADDLQRFLTGQPTAARPPSVFTRIWLWCRRVERIRDAGVILLAINALTIIWLLLGALAVALGALPADAPAGAFLGLLVAACLRAPALWFGIKVSQHRLWAIWFSTLFTVAYFFHGSMFFAVLLSGQTQDYGGLYNGRDPAMLVAFALLGLMMDMIVFIALVLGLTGYYANRQTLAWSRSSSPSASKVPSLPRKKG